MATEPKSSQQSSQTSPLDDADQAIISVLKGDGGPDFAAKDILETVQRWGHKMSPATLARRLEALVAARHVIRSGQARSTKYRHDTFHDYFSVPPMQRRPVAYQASVLADYRPNIDHWISDEDHARLEKAGGGRKLDASTYSRAIAQKLLIDLSFASSALEGNTYTYLDTQVLIEFGQEAEGKAQDETTMILNHKEAINYLIENIRDITPSAREIKTLHALLSRGLSNMDPRAVGNIRTMPIDHIGGSSYLPLTIPQRLEDELALLADKASLIENPFEQSLFLMVFISYLQAFHDVNKRTGRLACNIPLLKNGLAPFSFIEIDKTAYVRGLLSFYELNRWDIISEAFVDGYIKSAARYDAYVERPKATVDLEFRRRRDLYACVKKYVQEVGAGNTVLSPAEFAEAEFDQDAAEIRQQLAELVTSIVESLGEGNHIAYGISRDEFSAYEDESTQRHAHAR